MNRIRERGLTETLKIEHEMDLQKALRIINKAAESIKNSLPELAFLVNNLEPNVDDTVSTISTNGTKLLFSPTKVLKDFKTNGYKGIICQYLHVLFHMVLGHLSRYKQYADRDVFDKVADLEVGRILDYLWNKEGREEIDEVDAELNYYAAKDDRKLVKKLSDIALKHKLDDHRYWVSDEQLNEVLIEVQILLFGNTLSNNLDEREAQIEELSKLIEEALKQLEETIDKEFGRESGCCTEMHYAQNRDRDWKSLLEDILKKDIKEKLDLDSIDKDLYQYGLELYGDVPIIEPWIEEEEELETNNIVIAIDTSGSCSGKIADIFLGEIESILCDLKPYMNQSDTISIIECDTKIQNEQTFGVNDIYKGMLQTRELHGFGGTDFRPVFERVCDMAEENKDISKSTLIYLSDGYGEYPDEDPGCNSIFVIPKEGYSEGDLYDDYVPDYITKIYMEA